jgi:hypothetical protein
MSTRLTSDVFDDLVCRRFASTDFCFIFAPCGYDEPEILPS